MHTARVCVDGAPYSYQATGGITRIYNELLPCICQIDDSLYIELVCSRHLQQETPNHPHISKHTLRQINLPVQLGRIREFLQSYGNDLLFDWQIKPLKHLLWHSTYFRIPQHWDGLLVTTVYDMIHEKFPHYYPHPRYERFLEQKQQAILSADAVICISDTTRLDVLDVYRIDPGKVHVTKLAHSNSFRTLNLSEITFGSLANEPFLLYVGKRARYKNFKLLVEAYSKWEGKSTVALVVVGKRWNSAELSFLEEKRLLSKVQLLENINDDVLCQLYNQAIALVYPSLYEGFGLPIIEALACGCPVIASDIPASREVAGDFPIYFSPDEIETLIYAFDIVLAEGRNSQRVRGGLDWVKRFTWRDTAKKTLEAYRSVFQ